MVNKRDYESYNIASKNYDKTRVPVGLDVIMGCLSDYRVPVNEIDLISIGCGTGNYEVELASRVKRVYGIDVSSGMIEKAKEKSKDIVNIEFHVGDGINLDMIKNDEFDVALFNQSLHHIGGYDHQLKALQEAYRVLKPEGMVIIQTCSQRQLEDGFWWQDLIPEATRKLQKKLMPIPELINVLQEIGFGYRGRIVPIDVVVQGDSYLNVDGIFDKKWRDGDSSWSLATKEEIKNAQEKITEMKDKGTIDEYIKRREELRNNIGQITFVYSVKK